jgi:flavin reductase ActVB
MDAQFVSGTTDSDLFRQAMTRFASGITIVTTADAVGTWWGFTASAFSSLSLQPALILVCLATSADSHPAFTSVRGFIVNVLSREHESLALRFATKGVDKFVGTEFRPGAADGYPVLDDALVSLKCTTHERHEAGDHTILIGEVCYIRIRTNGQPALHYDRRFWELAERRADR